MTTEPKLAELRSRAEATLHERTRPLPQRMAEFRGLLRESRLCSASTDIIRLLEDSF